jgi:hypothetical protein
MRTSHSVQPMVQPTENHRHVCAEAQALEPFLHAHGAPACTWVPTISHHWCWGASGARARAPYLANGTHI